MKEDLIGKKQQKAIGVDLEWGSADNDGRALCLTFSCDAATKTWTTEKDVAASKRVRRGGLGRGSREVAT